MVANTVIELSISVHKHAVSETNENVDNKALTNLSNYFREDTLS